MRKEVLRTGVAIAIAAITVGGAHTATASVTRCRRAIAKEHGKYVTAVAKALDQCKRGVVQSGNPAALGDCAPAALPKVAKAKATLRAKIAAACGGTDHTCGTAGDELLAAIGWGGGQCRGFEQQCTAIVVDDCGGVGDCLACMGEAAAEQAVDGLLYDRFNFAVFHPNDATPAARAANRCELAVAQSALGFLAAKTKALHKCWDRKLAGKTGFADAEKCPDTDPTGATAAQIARAEAKSAAAICSACGGGASCSAPLALDAFAQTPFACPDVQVPPNAVHPTGVDCGHIAVADLASYADCVQCVVEYKADCMAAAGVGDGDPALGIAYPPECNPTPDGCPGTWAFTADGTNADVDFGWRGILHDETLPSSSQFTVALSGCSGDAPACGECLVVGAIPNAGRTNRRCQGDISGANGTWVPCASNAECVGPGNACVLFFGPPQPVAQGGVGACILNELAPNVGGTVNVDSGQVALSMQASWRFYLVTLNAQSSVSCPRCVAGTCTDGPRAGQPCTVDGTGPFGTDVSLDCPPDQNVLFSDSTYRATLTTGTQTATLSAANPACTAFGTGSLRCPCDTCDGPDAKPCMSNADCGVGHACGGLRCLADSPTSGGACNAEGTGTDPVCGSGTCGHVGEPTKPNACNNLVCNANPGDTDSVDEGRCSVSPNDSECAIESFRGCVSNADCPAAGDSCKVQRRQCFTMNGNVGDDVVAAGVADASHPTLAGLFCMPPTASGPTNSLYGLPGLGRVTLRGTVTLQ